MTRLQTRIAKLEDHLAPFGTPFFMLVYPDGTCQARGIRYRCEEEARAANPDNGGGVCITIATAITRCPGETVHHTFQEDEGTVPANIDTIRAL